MRDADGSNLEHVEAKVLEEQQAREFMKQDLIEELSSAYSGAVIPSTSLHSQQVQLDVLSRLRLLKTVWVFLNAFKDQLMALIYLSAFSRMSF